AACHPGEGLDIPIWILGSSTDSARLAAKMGLPYAFASHFAPAEFMRAIQLYRDHFQPSKQLQAPYVLACVNIVMADTDAEAKRLFTSLQQLFIGIVTGQRKPLQPPVDDIGDVWNDMISASVGQMLQYSFFGAKDTVRKKLEAFVAATGVDEIMATAHIYDQEARLHSYRLFAELFQ
ncbi:MAG TPA: MsnO8 family LLM class oxidoreductase, partial [Chitinophaga sp.]